ncbi:hypothetical protein GCM10023096_40720 [Nonomuraea ferruginea]
MYSSSSIHVIEKLWASAWCLHRPADPAAEDWVATHALALLVAGGNAEGNTRCGDESGAMVRTSREQGNRPACGTVS